MSEHKGKTGGAGLVALCAAVALGVSGGYVLSTGPFAWLVNRGYVAAEPLEGIYAPLKWLAQSSDWFRGWAEWYIALWS